MNPALIPNSEQIGLIGMIFCSYLLGNIVGYVLGKRRRIKVLKGEKEMKNIESFIQNFIINHEGGHISREEIRKAYKKYCKEEKKEKVNENWAKIIGRLIATTIVVYIGFTLIFKLLAQRGII